MKQFVSSSALQPRLKTKIRVIDLVFFIAEHDDHHLARISELKRCYRTRAIASGLRRNTECWCAANRHRARDALRLKCNN